MKNLILAVAVLLSLATIPALANEPAVQSTLPTRAERKISLTLGLAATSQVLEGSQATIPHLNLLLDYNYNSHVSFEAKIQGNGFFNQALVGTRIFLLKEQLSPCLYARLGVSSLHFDGGHDVVDEMRFIVETGASLDMVHMGGFTWYLEAGVQFLPSTQDPELLLAVGTGIGYRF